MNIKQITELSVKILALYWVLNAARGLSSDFIFFSYSAADTEQLIKHLMSNVAPVIVMAVVLFFMAKPFSKYIAPKADEKQSTVIGMKPLELHSVLLSIFGFILITISTIPMVKSFTTIVTEATQSADDSFRVKMFLFGYFIQLIIGLWFAFGSKGISGFVYKLRYSNR